MKITVKHYDNEYSAEFSDESSVHEALEMTCRLLVADYDQKMVEEAVKVKAVELGEDIGIEFVNDDAFMKNPWDFVEKYFPNYHSSDKILLANELDMIVTRYSPEWSESVKNLFTNEMLGSINKATEVRNSYYVDIYEEAIRAYIKSLKNAK